MALRRLLLSLALVGAAAGDGGLDASPCEQLDAKSLRRTARRISTNGTGALVVRFYLNG
jgi:hypothetical protein